MQLMNRDADIIRSDFAYAEVALRLFSATKEINHVSFHCKDPLHNKHH